MPHDIDILIEDSRWQDADLPALARRAIDATLDHLGLGPAELSVLACDDARIASLNGDFRDKPTPTNVLSWPEEDLSAAAHGAAPRAPRPDPGGTLSLGDIAIAYDTCAREAADRAMPMGDHVTHLLVHGTLHLLGYDHISDTDATRMEALEVEILGKLGLPDPY
ncbi:rRNA maturation RNase YbeY [uncultured Tateyamaria sp.]|uniref:rRNA maturation RNase YbeY n=1 Tax=uncultured Tateyamaria sp. TaxID=455651 RepID=UPI002639E508|nr:rRNA maturation RNase YbeY [uncultured Tateyamaria sp.]